MPAERLFLLQYGEECTPKWMSVRGADSTLRWVPVIGILVRTNDQWLILETGFSRQALDDDAACRAIYGPEVSGANEYFPPKGLAGEPFVTALKQLDLTPEDIALAAVSHLHIDHSGGLPLLEAARVPVAIQRKELEFGLQRADIAEAYYRPDYAERTIDWRVLDGDAELAPGVSVLSTPGHTPGHMSYRIDLPETGTWIFTLDAADLGENLFDRSPIGSTADPADEPRVLPSLERLLREAEDLDARIVPCHDPYFWKALRHPPGGHR
jgi:N-acyl homoserine lactone hydrolase